VQQQTPPAATAGRGGRAGAGGTSPGGPVGFYNFDTTAGAGAGVADVKPAETHQKIVISGEALAYTTRAGFIALRNATTGQSEAHMFFTSYEKDGVADPSSRALVFFVGGEPGVAASWQELGGFGPKRVRWSGEAAGGVPDGWADNPHTLLAQADLVFVNPVGTAFSRPDQPNRGPDFWNTTGDLASLGEFVRSFLNAYDRRGSRLFVAGDDFGTARAAGLANYLDEHQIPVAGVVLFSITPAADAVAGDTQSVTLMPSLTLAAWHHKKLPADLQAMTAEQVADQARQFAAREYLHALYKGDRMTAEERTKVIADLSRLTGLSKAFVVNNTLRMPLDRFDAELLRDTRQTLSNDDARASGYVPPPSGGGRGGGGGGFGSAAPAEYRGTHASARFLAVYEAYLRREMGFVNTANAIYYLSSGGVANFASTGSDEANLASALSRNPGLRLFVAVAFFDLRAPFYANEFTLAHLNVAPEVRTRNITVGHYEAGRMAYTDERALPALSRDVARFITGAAARPRTSDTRGR
jgi:carboxypeptidase C (cathepsin A)